MEQNPLLFIITTTVYYLPGSFIK